MKKVLIITMVMIMVLSSFVIVSADTVLPWYTGTVPAEVISETNYMASNYDVVISWYNLYNNWNVYGYNYPENTSATYDKFAIYVNGLYKNISNRNGSTILTLSGTGCYSVWKSDTSTWYIQRSTSPGPIDLQIYNDTTVKNRIIYTNYAIYEGDTVLYQPYQPDSVEISARSGQQITLFYLFPDLAVLSAEATGNQIIHQVRHPQGIPFGGFLAGTNRYEPFSNIPSEDYVAFPQVIAPGGVGVSSLWDIDSMFLPELEALERVTYIPSGDQQFITITVDNNHCVWTKSSVVTGTVIDSNFDENTLGDDMPDIPGQGSQGWIPDGYDDTEALQDGIIERDTLTDIKNAIVGFINNTTSMMSAAATAISVFISNGSDFVGSIGGIFAWLPVEVQAVLTSGLILLIVIGVLKFLL